MVSPGAGGGDAQDSGTERMSIMSSKEEKGGRYNGRENIHQPADHPAVDQTVSKGSKEKLSYLSKGGSI